MRILETLALKGLDFRRGTDPDEITLCCPFLCQDDRSYHLGVNVKKNKGQCFKCGWKSGGKTIQKILARLRIAFGSITLAWEPERTERQVEAPTLPDDFTLLHDCGPGDFELWDAKRYLLDRGITEKQIKRHYVGASLSGRLRNRIVFPVTHDGYFLGTVNRDFSGLSDARYKNSFGDRSLWGCDTTSSGEVLVLAEGIFKALAVERTLNRLRWKKTHGFAAINGSDLSTLQVSQLRASNWGTIFILPDPDKIGLKKALKIADQLVREKFTVRVPSKYPKQQADDMPPEVLERILKSAVPYTWSYESRLRLYMGSL